MKETYSQKKVKRAVNRKLRKIAQKGALETEEPKLELDVWWSDSPCYVERGERNENIQRVSRLCLEHIDDERTSAHKSKVVFCESIDRNPRKNDPFYLSCPIRSLRCTAVNGLVTCRHDGGSLGVNKSACIEVVGSLDYRAKGKVLEIVFVNESEMNGAVVAAIGNSLVCGFLETFGSVAGLRDFWLPDSTYTPSSKEEVILRDLSETVVSSDMGPILLAEEKPAQLMKYREKYRCEFQYTLMTMTSE